MSGREQPSVTSEVRRPPRWLLVGVLFAISVVTYMDRVNISVTARQMMPALGLTQTEMGRIFSAFVLGYALFQVPGGWLGDRWGARRVLTGAIIWWSAGTALTALAPTLMLAEWFGVMGALILVRFLIGVGEAAALPNFNRAVADWLPRHQRGLGIAVVISGIGLGSAITPPVTAWLMVTYGWQTAFYAAALLGLLVAILWYVVAGWPGTARSEPHQPAVLQHVSNRDGGPGAVPWRAFARSPTIWWLVVSYACLGYVAYIYMSWFYLYLVTVRGFDVLRGSLFGAGPFLAIAVFCPLGGWITDRLARHCTVDVSRRLTGSVGMLLSGLCILAGAYTNSPMLAIALLSLGAGWLYFSVGAYWATTTDLAPAHAGTLSGLMNTGANIGGTISPTLTPWLAQEFGWPAALATAALLAITGGLLWMRIRPGDTVDHSP